MKEFIVKGFTFIGALILASVLLIGLGMLLEMILKSSSDVEDVFSWALLIPSSIFGGTIAFQGARLWLRTMQLGDTEPPAAFWGKPAFCIVSAITTIGLLRFGYSASSLSSRDFPPIIFLFVASFTAAWIRQLFRKPTP